LPGPPTIRRPAESLTLAKTPVIRGQPVCGTFSPPPTVWRPLPGLHWMLGSIAAHGPPGGAWAGGLGAAGRDAPGRPDEIRMIIRPVV